MHLLYWTVFLIIYIRNWTTECLVYLVNTPLKFPSVSFEPHSAAYPHGIKYLHCIKIKLRQNWTSKILAFTNSTANPCIN